MSKNPKKYPFSLPSYWFAVNTCRAFLFLCNSFWFKEKDKFKNSKPIIFVANHTSHLDPPLIVSSRPRPVRFLAKASLFKGLLGRGMKSWGQVPVYRTGKAAGISVIKIAIDVLAEGSDICLFVEGTRSVEGRFKPHRAKTGAATIAHKSNAVVVPLAIIGSHKSFPKGSKLPRRCPLKIVFGDPISSKDFCAEKLTSDSAKIFTEQLVKAIDDLLPEEQKALPESWENFKG